jgi:tRNA threonylcarbamoyladenosine biosynthesis protein TsaE
MMGKKRRSKIKNRGTRGKGKAKAKAKGRERLTRCKGARAAATKGSRAVLPTGMFQSNSPEETHKHARLAAKLIGLPPVVILLEGPLGAGKTEWARAFIKAYLGSKTIVTSPTYSIVNAYKKGRRQVYHFDLYRLQGMDDLESVGFWDFIEGNNVLLVEWGNELPAQWPTHVQVLKIQLTPISNTERQLEIIRLSGLEKRT